MADGFNTQVFRSRKAAEQGLGEHLSVYHDRKRG